MRLAHSIDGVTHALAMVAALGCLSPARRQTPPKQEADEVKVAVLLQMSHFVVWPSASGPEAVGELRVCVLGQDRWLPLLHEASRAYSDSSKGQRIGVKIRRLERPQDASGCHFVVIGTALKDQLWSVWRRSGAITVGSEDGFVEAGGIVNLIEENGRVRFELNMAAAEEIGLKFSSKLLRLAKLVTSNRN